MEIWSSFRGNAPDEKMVGAFGCGDPEAVWKCMVVIDLSDKEPEDWGLVNRQVGY